MNKFFKAVKQTAKDEAKKMARTVRDQSSEFIKIPGASEPGKKSQNDNEMSVMQQVMTGDGKVKDVSPIKEQEIAAQTKRRLAEIEAELRRLRMQREQASQEWTKNQNQILGISQEGQASEQTPQPVEMPSQGHKRGPRSAQQSKKGSMEVGRQHKG